jgi:GNAT superfamily N-acetyltransferase
MALTIGQASVADISALEQLRMDYLKEDFGELTDEQEQMLLAEIDPYLRWHLGTGLMVFVARDDEAGIVSCAWLLLIEKPPSPRFPRGRTGVLFNVYTDPAYRRRGLARRVMGALIEEAYRRQLDVLELNATDDGYPLYRSLGFTDDSSTHRAMRMML